MLSPKSIEFGEFSPHYSYSPIIPTAISKPAYITSIILIQMNKKRERKSCTYSQKVSGKQ